MKAIAKEKKPMPQSDTQKEFRSEFKMIKAKFIFADPPITDRFRLEKFRTS